MIEKNLLTFGSSLLELADFIELLTQAVSSGEKSIGSLTNKRPYHFIGMF